MNQRLLPAYPLFVNDPYFSIWSDSDNLNESDTIFWNGQKKKTYGIIYVDGVAYSFLGNVENTTKLQQTKLSIGAFSTNYTFESDEFILDLSFVSPLCLTNLDLLSRPVCYLTYNVTFKKEVKDFKISLMFNERHCYNNMKDYCIGGCFNFNDYELAYFGLNRQHPMSNTFDSVSADWGYTYVSGKEAFFTSEEAIKSFINKGELKYILNDNEEKYIVGIDKYHNCRDTISGKFLVAFDDLCSIFYFGEWLKGYYFRNGKTIFDAVNDAFYNYEANMEELAVFEKDLENRLVKYDDDYKLLCYASLRQSIGAHKLVENKDKELLFLSKECHSNGCIATVDITYPSMPLYLLYNPELVNAMVRPIYKFAKMPVWNFTFAPHDAGTYPYCLGQTYGMYADSKENDKYLSNSFQRARWNGIIVSHPMIYQYPANTNIYKEENQMPIEECSNMLVIAYATTLFGGSDELTKENYPLLKQWYGHLRDCGLVPKKQLCTDDFYEKIDKNVNLSIKAIMAIKCFILLAKKYNMLDDAIEAQECLDSFVKLFYKNFKNSKHTPLSYGCGSTTYSLKYNMAYDVIFDTNIFTKEIKEKEINCYLEQNCFFGVPLDNRCDLTKTDWILHVCLLTDDLSVQRQIYSKIVNFLKNSSERVPFTDLYHINNGLRKDFQNRPVQGGIFILLLNDEIKKRRG